jgi:aryl-alcohol dehydrogenase-like predicted oxidoreductase
VNLRLGGFAAPEDEPIEEPLSALAELKNQGLVQHIGLSTVSPRQLAEALAITEIVCSRTSTTWPSAVTKDS